MSKCISKHGEYSEHQATDGVCELCGVETAPITQDQLKELILEHATTREIIGGVVCSGCGFLIAPKPGRQHWNVAGHIAEVIMARLEATQ